MKDKTLNLIQMALLSRISKQLKSLRIDGSNNRIGSTEKDTEQEDTDDITIIYNTEEIIIANIDNNITSIDILYTFKQGERKSRPLFHYEIELDQKRFTADVPTSDELELEGATIIITNPDDLTVQRAFGTTSETYTITNDMFGVPRMTEDIDVQFDIHFDRLDSSDIRGDEFKLTMYANGP